MVPSHSRKFRSIGMLLAFEVDHLTDLFRHFKALNLTVATSNDLISLTHKDLLILINHQNGPPSNTIIQLLDHLFYSIIKEKNLLQTDNGHKLKLEYISA